MKPTLPRLTPSSTCPGYIREALSIVPSPPSTKTRSRCPSTLSPVGSVSCSTSTPRSPRISTNRSECPSSTFGFATIPTRRIVCGAPLKPPPQSPPGSAFRSTWSRHHVPALEGTQHYPLASRATASASPPRPRRPHARTPPPPPTAPPPRAPPPPRQRRARPPPGPEARTLERLRHSAEHRRSHRRFPHESAAPHVLWPGLELRFDEHHSLLDRGCRREKVAERDRERDKGQIRDEEIR